MQEESHLYGIDWNGPMPSTEDNNRVLVPCTECPLSDLACHELEQRIDPLTEDGNYGIETYQAVVDFVNHSV